jgi:hypothetical protein
MKRAMLWGLLGLPGMLACGPHPPTGGAGGKQGHAGTAGTAGHAGQGGQAGTDGGTPPRACQPTHRFRAHASGDLNAKYIVEPRGDAGVEAEVTCFYFRNPFYQTKTLITGEVPNIDNASLIRRAFLYGTRSGQDGAVVPGTCVAPELTDRLLSSWFPDAQPIAYPDDVGLDFTSYPRLVLQVTYHNRSAASGRDASGIGYCTTDQKRPNIAGTVVLGTELGFNIPANSVDQLGARGDCVNLRRSGAGPVTIIASFPHMHRLGRGLTTEHIRGGQRVGYVSNIPLGTWNVDRQLRYAHDERGTGRIEFQPGDILSTKCYYSNPGTEPVGFGYEPDGENCHDYITAYPIAELRPGCGPFPPLFPQD